MLRQDASNSALNTMAGESALINISPGYSTTSRPPRRMSLLPINAPVLRTYFGTIDNELNSHDYRQSKNSQDLQAGHAVMSSLPFEMRYAHRQHARHLPSRPLVVGSCMQDPRSYQTVRDSMSSPALHA